MYPPSTVRSATDHRRLRILCAVDVSALLTESSAAASVADIWRFLIFVTGGGYIVLTDLRTIKLQALAAVRSAICIAAYVAFLVHPHLSAILVIGVTSLEPCAIRRDFMGDRRRVTVQQFADLPK